MRFPLRPHLFLLANLLLFPALAHAANEGQDDLDKAMELKLSAQSLNDLGEVVKLCRSALASGLDDTNKEFATKMLTGTLVQRAEALSNPIFDNPQPPPQWPIMRRQALLDLEEAAQVDGKQFEIHYLIGRLEGLPGGSRTNARKALSEAIELAKTNPHNRANALVLRGNLTEDPAQRRADYDQAVELAPKDAEAIRTRGLFNLLEKKYEPALADLDKAIELEPDHADSHEARGVILFLTNKLDDALKSFDRELELQPKSAIAHTHRARIHALKNEPEKAMSELEEALKLDPRLVSALVLRARLYQQAGKKDEALIDASEAVRLAPSDSQALQVHAVLLATSGKFPDAISDLQQLRRAEPDNIELLMQLGLFYAVDKQPRKAIETYTSVLLKDPNLAAALRSRGDAWLTLGKMKEAVGDYESAVKLDPKDSGALNNLAWLLATSPVDDLRDGKRSVELGKEAARITEFKAPHILSTLAAGYAETGDFDSAVNWAKKAVELGTKDEDTKDIAEQLKKELASYESKNPWREKIELDPKLIDPEPEELPDPDKKSASAKDVPQ